MRIRIFIWCGCGSRLPKCCESGSTTLLCGYHYLEDIIYATVPVSWYLPHLSDWKRQILPDQGFCQNPTCWFLRYRIFFFKWVLVRYRYQSVQKLFSVLVSLPSMLWFPIWIGSWFNGVPGFAILKNHQNPGSGSGSGSGSGFTWKCWIRIRCRSRSLCIRTWPEFYSRYLKRKFIP